MESKQRTAVQNNSLHLYCTEIAELLNEHGISLEVFYKNIEADHTMESVKELWRSFARSKYGKVSTADLTTKELQAIYEEVNRHVAKFGIHVPFPSEESLINYEDL